MIIFISDWRDDGTDKCDAKHNRKTANTAYNNVWHNTKTERKIFVSIDRIQCIGTSKLDWIFACFSGAFLSLSISICTLFDFCTRIFLVIDSFKWQFSRFFIAFFFSGTDESTAKWWNEIVSRVWQDGISNPTNFVVNATFNVCRLWLWTLFGCLRCS